MKIIIDKDKCIGCGTCAALMPEIFEIDADFKAVVKKDSSFDVAAIKDVIASCPVEAISFIEE